MAEGEQAAAWLQKPFNTTQIHPVPLFGLEIVVFLNCMKNQVGEQRLRSTMFPTQPGATGVDTVL